VDREAPTSIHSNARRSTSMLSYKSPYQGMPHRKSWQNYHKQNIPKGWHIHHLDGNPHNNNPENLICVSKHTHWCIHLLQGDINADFIKHAWSDESRKKASATHKEKIINGTHHTAFKKGHSATKGFTGKKHSEKTKNIFNEQRSGQHNISCRPEIKEKRKQQLLNNNPAKNPEIQKKMRISAQNRAPVICPHCNKIGKVPGMYRYHFDKCKFNAGQFR
jgi:hypothetical protein